MTCFPASDPVSGGVYDRGEVVVGEKDVGVEILLVEVLIECDGAIIINFRCRSWSSQVKDCALVVEFEARG